MLAFALTALLPLLASAQNATTASAMDINEIEANFQNAQLTPQLIPQFAPQGTLDVAFGGNDISIGENLTQTAVGTSPTLTVMPAAGAQNINTNAMYTIAMVDANPVGTDETAVAQTRHWLVNTVGLSGTAPPYAINYTGATSITDYAGPGPAEGSGSHRYVLLVYYQSSSFSPPANLSMAGTPLGTFFIEDYVSQSGLGPLVAANYFQVENGVATVTVAPTSAVNTATLASTSASSSPSGASNSGTGTGAASRGASSTGGASASASATSKAAAGKPENSKLGVGLAVGLVGLVGTLLGASLGF